MAEPTQPNKTAEDHIREAGLGTPSEAKDKVIGITPIGKPSTAIGSSFFGLNHRQTPSPIPINKDVYGLTFFTRPDMNFTTENLRNVREMTPLLTTDSATLPAIIRHLLDSRLVANGGSSPCPFVDPQQAFIPMLTNHLLSMPGWPDMEVQSFTAPAGVMKETFGHVDDTVKIYRAYDITANFRNIPGNPIFAMFMYWLTYASEVRSGKLVPYWEKVVDNEIDYMTRIYRLVLNPTRTHVTFIAACGAAYPVSAPSGALANFEADRPYNPSTQDQVSIPFTCFGAMYQDPILLYEFNATVCLFNDTMKDGNRERMYTQVPQYLLTVFNNMGYPRIDPATWELQWWVPKEDYSRMLGGLDVQRSDSSLGSEQWTSVKTSIKI